MRSVAQETETTTKRITGLERAETCAMETILLPRRVRDGDDAIVSGECLSRRDSVPWRTARENSTSIVP
jgi:hypothetical protein